MFGGGVVIVMLPLFVAVLVRPDHEASRSEPRTPLHALDWSGVARCESGGDPHINTGNGYYGYLQESETFWRTYGGLAFAVRPDLATETEQVTVAERGLAVQGIGSWPVCGRWLRDAA